MVVAEAPAPTARSWLSGSSWPGTAWSRQHACRPEANAASARATPWTRHALPGPSSTYQRTLRTPRTLSAGDDASSDARVALRVLVVAHDQMTGERTRAINSPTAFLRTVDLGMDARKPLTAAQLTTIAGWRDREENLARRTCRAEAVRLARRITTLGIDLATNKRGIAERTADAAPELLQLPGIGPVVAAAVLIDCPTPDEYGPRPRWPPSPGPAPSTPPRATPSDTASTTEAIDASTGP